MKKLFIVLFLGIANYVYAGEIKICNKELSTPCYTWQNCFWVDKMMDDPNWTGIAIQATNFNGNFTESITFFLPGYSGAKEYVLEGTREMGIGKIKNATFLQATYSLLPPMIRKSRWLL